jgi:ribonuclease G
MSKEMVISATRHETRVAVLDNDQLVEVYFQRANEYSLAGSIHKGKVTRVLPGMQSAFVDIGLERDAFLYVSDFLEEHEDIDRVTGEELAPRERRRDRGRGRERERRGAPPQPAEGAEAPAPAAEAPESVAAIPAAAGEPRREERAEGREGRRRRRRRGRGRGGFPEAKYAGAVPQQAPAGAEVAAGEEAEAAEVAEEELEPVLLPGESLAKYRHAPPVEAPAAPAAEAEGAAVEEAELEQEEADETLLTEYDEPIHYPPDNVLPDAPLHPLPAEGEAKGEPEPEPMGVTPVGAEAPSAQEIEEAEEAAISGPASFLEDEEDLDIQEMILGELDEGDGPAAEEAAAEEAVAAPEEEPTAATAVVREPGGRFPHRVSRRRRRRGGDRGEGGEALDAEAPRAEADAGAPQPEQRERIVSAQARTAPSISELLKPGQEIIVQIAKEPLGQKGARITSHVALPGRFVVYMPTLEHMGVSRRIGSDEERLRLKRVLQAQRPGPVGGFITRTAAEGRTEEEIGADMAFLYNLWQDIKIKADKKPAPLLLHHDLDIVQRILRDQLADDFKAIWIDSEETFESVLSFLERFQPALVGKVKMYTRDTPIFDAFGITQELEKALRPKVWLKSGGYIVINQTEALVAIDVNTGKFVGKGNRLEDTIVKTNMEAIKEIVRQIRLRDLGGIIVIDFIDMDERKNRQKVMQALEEAMRADRAPFKILQFNDFGLVAITRKRVKQSLERTLCSPCPHCEGAGYVKSVQTVIGEILTEARKLAASIEGKDVMLRVHPDVAKVIKSHGNKYLEELEEVLRRPVLVKSDPQLHHEKFDLA